MSRFVGDALVAGAPESERVPEMVTVKLTRGHAAAMAAAMDILIDTLLTDGYLREAEYGKAALSALRTQIGGAR